MTETKDIILKLKKVKEEKNLSLDKILELMQEHDYSSTVSKTTLSRVFRDGSEDQTFNYEGTIRPIANVLLDLEIENDDDIDTRAYKSILKLKKELIDDLEERIRTVENTEKAKYHDKLAAETEKFQKDMEFVKNQIELKDQRIDLLLAANERLSVMNNKMLEQFLDCPLKHKECASET